MPELESSDLEVTPEYHYPMQQEPYGSSHHDTTPGANPQHSHVRDRQGYSSATAPGASASSSMSSMRSEVPSEELMFDCEV